MLALLEPAQRTALDLDGDHAASHLRDRLIAQLPETHVEVEQLLAGLDRIAGSIQAFVCPTVALAIRSVVARLGVVTPIACYEAVYAFVPWPGRQCDRQPVGAIA
ncbi:hypothetical protein GTA26_28050 [Rhodococcus hoagii]|nr:hypothetical protein [Prescottella equi]